MNTIDCKKITDLDVCNSRVDCIVNRSKKCQKKPNATKKKKPSPASPELVQDMVSIKLDSVSTKSVSPSLKSVSPPASKCSDAELLKMREQLNHKRKEYDNQIRECEEHMFGEFIHTYFKKIDERLTHEQLLVGLQKYYVQQKTKDVHFTLGFQEFINKFPQKTNVEGTNFKKQHVFEALCRLLLYFNYDKGELGVKKHFYSSLENFVKGDRKRINTTILQSKINEGSKAGIVDIFFESQRNINNDDLWACEHDCSVKKHDSESNDYFLIQNKYYDKEKSNISNYDVTRIYSLASLAKKESDKFSNGPIKIILMVNNEDAVSHNLDKAKQQYPGLLYKVYGVVSLNTWFQQMLYDLFLQKTITPYLQDLNVHSKVKPILELRFHQKYIVSCSNRMIATTTQKLIWGAVPRSGKSYMIGGLISEQAQAGNKNNIVIILGALTETLTQFMDMFGKFSNFDGYKIITPDSKEKEGPLNIYLLSQEWLKDKVKPDKTYVSGALFGDKMVSKFPRLFHNRNIDLYFDEVHKGGTTDNSQSIIHAFHNSGVKIHIFIMVTATFAKPTLRYTQLDFIGNGSQETDVIEWNYTDQQNMKHLTDETKLDMMINSRTGLQKDTLNEVFRYYREYYGINYLKALSDEYKKYPELVLISPQSIQINSTVNMPQTDDISQVFLRNLSCSACRPSNPVAFYKNPANIFKNVEPVNELLNYLSHHIYNYFQHNLRYPITSPHTELWFLPDKHLYGSDNECREKNECMPTEIDENMDEDAAMRTSIPNIEPLTRGLAIKITKHAAFKRYNILIVHNTNLSYLGANINKTNLFGEFVSESGKRRIEMFDFKDKKTVGLSEQIKAFEKASYCEGKSLIVLTGAKLRLGISLPCADIAFNFDDIKSIDNNYQTMFRVLTERERPDLKKYGYYVDFNKSRAIQFIYEYNKIYGEAKKLGSREAIESLQTLLFTFNYNGLNMFQENTTKELGLYNQLIHELELNEEGYVRFWTKKQNVMELIKKSLYSAGNMQILKEIFKMIGMNKNRNLPKMKKTLLVEKYGDQNLPTIVPPKSDDMIPEEEEEEEDTITDDYGELINSLAQELPAIIVLLALFSNNEKKECSDIEACLHLSLQNISKLDAQCSCDTISNANILDCFFNSPGLINGKYKYGKAQLKRIIELIHSLVILDESDLLRINLNFIFDNIRKLMTKSDGIIHDMTTQDIEEKIEQYLSVREEEKNKYGEVFTPISLINELFDNLDKSVWSNPELKWLDPANGIGNFPMVVFQRLMVGLAKWEPNKEKRSKHIIENMLYMVELNPKNVKISRKIFGSNANICCADFLNDAEKCFKQWGVEKFDVVIGNPPFQTPKKEESGTTAGLGTLWDKFIIKSLDVLNDSKYLCFITPPGWRKPDNKLYTLMTSENQLLYLHIYGEKHGQQLFNVSQRVDLYIIQKTPKHKKTEIIDELGTKLEIDLSLWPFLPNYEYNVIQRILTTEDNGIRVIYNTFYHSSKNMNKTKKEKTGNFKHPVIHGITQDGLVFIYSDDTSKGHFHVQKVILNANRNQYPVNDFDGKYGMSELSFGIPITSKKHGDDIVKAINTDAFKEVIKATKWGAFQTDYRMFKYFKPDFYKYFLTHGHVATKVQAVVRGHQQRKKTQKRKEAISKIQSVARKYQQRKKHKTAKKGGKNGTKKRRPGFFGGVFF
jgi:hypothetical protein